MPGNSTASTVPATSPQLREAKAARAQQQRDAEKNQLDPPVVTPPCKAPKTGDADGSSRTKLNREVQSSALLESEPKTGVPVPKAKAGAGGPAARKAAAKPKAKKEDPKENGSTTGGRKNKDIAVKSAAKEEDNAEDHTKVAKAVQQSLNRSGTADASQLKTPARKGDTDGGGASSKPPHPPPAEKGCAEPEEEEDSSDPQADPEALERARLKRVNHARFMRFSRSLKSALAKLVKEL